MTRIRRSVGAALIAVLAGATTVGCNSAKEGWDGPDADVVADQVAAAGGGSEGGSSSGGSAESAEAGGSQASEPADDTASSAPTDDNDSGSGGGGSSGGSGEALPDGFPVPDGAKVTPVSADSDGTLRWLVTLSSNEGAYEFWKKELADAGFSITDDFDQDTVSQIQFTGNGYSEGKISIVGSTAALTLKK